MLPLCAILCIHANTLSQSSPPPFPSLCQTGGWDSSHLQCVIAGSPPLLDGREKGGVYQNCADSALSVVAFFIIRHTTLLPCQKETAECLDSCKVCGARIIYNELSALPHSLPVSLSHTNVVKRLYQWPFILGSLSSVADAAHCAYVWADLLYRHILIHPHAHMLF